MRSTLFWLGVVTGALAVGALVGLTVWVIQGMTGPAPVATPAPAKPVLGITSLPTPVTPTAVAVPKPSPTLPPAKSFQPEMVGQPTVLTVGGRRFVYVVLNNPSHEVFAGTLVARLRREGKVVTEARGAVNDLLPNRKRVVQLLAEPPTPDPYDTVEVLFADLIIAGPTEADKIAFLGEPQVTRSDRLSVTVQVRNSGTRPHSGFLSVALLDAAANVVGYASAELPVLAPGEIRQITFVNPYPNRAYTEMLFQVDFLK